LAKLESLQAVHVSRVSKVQRQAKVCGTQIARFFGFGKKRAPPPPDAPKKGKRK